jgi:hypothetical protein
MFKFIQWYLREYDLALKEQVSHEIEAYYGGAGYKCD